MRYIHSGALAQITEKIVATQPGASDKHLFQGGFAEVDKQKAFTRIDVILRAFAVAFPDQSDSVAKLLTSFEGFLRECCDSRIEMKTFHDTVWLPFARSTQRAFNEARETIGAPMPQLKIDEVSENSRTSFVSSFAATLSK